MADDWEDVSQDAWEDISSPSVATQAPQVQNRGSFKSPKDMNAIIAQRPSMLKDAMTNPISFKEHPFQRTFRDLGAGFEVLEGVPASVALDIQKGNMKDIIPNIGKVVTGQRPSQRGDILRAVGVPEPIAATIGLVSGMVGGSAGSTSKVSKLSSITKYLPDNIASNILAKGASTAYKASGLKDLVTKWGKPVIARTLSILSSVPKEQVESAIDNPKFLSKNFLNKEKESVQSLYKKVINPIIDDSSKRVDISKLDITDLGLTNASGEPTKSWVSMTNTEKNKLLKWSKKAFDSKGDLSFNEVDGLIGQMDEALGSVYRKEAKGVAVDYSNDFIRNVRQIRNKLNVIRKEQYPEAAKVLNRYEDYKNGEKLYKAFEVYHPHLWQTLIGGGLGVTKDPRLGAALIAGSVPKVQALGIRGADILGRNLAQSGSAIPEAAFNQWRVNQGQ